MFDIILYQRTLKRGRKLLASVESRLKGSGTEYRLHIANREKGAIDIVKSLTEAGAKKLIVFGGDGTLNEVLNGIADPASCELGLIPAGTGNDFSVAAKIPKGMAALDLILSSEPKFTDYIQFDDGKRSVNIAGTGIDVDILQRCARKKYGGNKSKYFFSLLSSLAHYKAVELEVSADGGEPVRYHALIACVCNGSQLGGGIPMCPDAVIDDGKLELIVADSPPRRKIPGALVKLMRGKVLTLPITHRVSCTSARITAPSGGFLAQYDGEIRACESLTAEIVSGKLKMFRG
jgi:diacylglycerol kinase (ATP)